MSQFMDLCLRRQTCREFSDKPVEHEKLVACVDAARLAPSGCNAQPWSFVAVEKPETVKQVGECVLQLGMNPYAAAAKAFVVIVEEPATLMPKISCLVEGQYFAKGDLGAATAYLCLEAASQELGTCQFGIFDRVKMRTILNIPGDKPISALIGIGYPLHPETVRPKQRKSLEEVARFI